MQNMPVPKIIIQSCAFYRHRYISTAVNTSLVNLSLVFKTVFILLITLLQFFLWHHFQHTYLQPITIHLLRVNVADYKIENRYKVKKNWISIHVHALTSFLKKIIHGHCLLYKLATYQTALTKLIRILEHSVLGYCS